jgi:hypothetical protein
MDENDKARALRLLEEVYWLTKDQGRPVPATKLAATIGTSEAEAVAGLEYLKQRDLINLSGDTGEATANTAGIAFYENARKHPDQPPPGFSGSINYYTIHHMYGGFQQAGAHSTQHQTITYNAQELDGLRKVIEILVQHIDELKLDAADKSEALVQVNTIKAQLSSVRPSRNIIREAGKTLRSVIEGAIGGLLTEGITHWRLVHDVLMRITS